MANRRLGDVPVGTSLYLKESGVRQPYIVVHHGKPSALYDDSCDGTWLRRKDIFALSTWGPNNNKYDVSNIASFLASSGPKYDDDIEAAIKTVKIPYCVGGGSAQVNSGADGYQCKLFPLGAYEIGLSNIYSDTIPVDGAKLDYFTLNNSPSDPKRMASYNGNVHPYWLRSCNTTYEYIAFIVETFGVAFASSNVSSTDGILPALIMPDELWVDDSDNIITNLIPSAPGSISVPTATSGSKVTITWTTATDPDGSVASYILERSVNGSGWTKIFQGDALTYTDTVGTDWGTMAYRVCAVDDAGDSGPYTTSETQTVAEGVLYITGPADHMGEKIAPFTVTFSVGVTGASAQGVSLTVVMDGRTIYYGTINTGEQIKESIDTRLLTGGTHLISARAYKEGYIQAVGEYIFSTKVYPLPDGGFMEMASNANGNPVYFRTVASAVDGLTLPVSTMITLTSTGWIIDGGRYKQTVAVESVRQSSAIVLVDCILSDDLDANEAIVEAWLPIMKYRPAQEDGAITFYSPDIPNIDVPVTVGVI